MKKKLWISLALLLVIPGLLFTVSCAKKAVKIEPSAVTEPAKEPAEEAAEEKVAEAPITAPTEEEAQVAAKEVAEEEEKKKEELIKEEEVEAVEEEKVAAVEAEEAKPEEIAVKNQFIYEDIYFEFDKSTLLPMALDTLKKKAEYLYKYPYITAVIEGHCDERGTNEYNLALGDRRAESAKSFLVDLGILPTRLTTVSYGEERPVDPRHNREAWAKNRRVHFVIE
jgi:peptidoglycan-associated lipoprotein